VRLEEIKKLDPKGMMNWIKDFPYQVENAVKIGISSSIKCNSKNVQNIILTGLGGSAIAGDLLRCYLSKELKIPFIVNRHYQLPEFVSKNSLVIVSSYSGNTEETISAYKDAIKKKARILCISTGGKIEKMAQKQEHSCIKIPPGLSPRAALGYSFFPLLVVLSRIGLIKKKENEIKETIKLLKEKSSILSNIESPENLSLKLAEKLIGKIPVIYSSLDLEAVNLRWRGQFAENAKQLAFGHVLPEMNHNELVGWKVLTDLMKQMHVIFLLDKEDHKRIQIRESITKEILANYADGITEVHSTGKSPLARIFSLVYYGDWTSFYLAILNHEDPEPVKVIDYLKAKLARI